MFSSEKYSARRKALSEKLTSGLILLPSNNESPANYPGNTFRFRQDSTFLYFFGINHPNLVGVIDIDSGQQTLFGDDYTMEDIIWMGPQPSIREQALHVGITHSAPLNELATTLQKAITQGRKIHFLPPYQAQTSLQLSGWLGMSVEALSSAVSVELAKAIVALREIKDEDEIAQIEEACRIGTRMHNRAIELCRPGVREQQIAAELESIALQEGAGVSFLSIVSQNGETLHNHNHSQILEPGRLLLVDAGAETTMNYCSDFTRTIPVSGAFTEQQRAIYELVLAAHDRAFEMARPGLCYWEVHNAAALILAGGLCDLGLMQGDPYEVVAAGAQALFMPHGLGHQMGLDVHDMENIGERYVGYDEQTLRSSTPGLSSLRMGKRLREGMVMTVEPGIYFIPALIDKWEHEGKGEGFINFKKVRQYIGFGGIRIEDDLLVTAPGCRMLGAQRPAITVAELTRG